MCQIHREQQQQITLTNHCAKLAIHSKKKPLRSEVVVNMRMCVSSILLDNDST